MIFVARTMDVMISLGTLFKTLVFIQVLARGYISIKNGEFSVKPEEILAII